MIINISILSPSKILPLDYRPTFVSLIKHAMSIEYPDRYEELYKSGAKRKSFTFSVALPKPKFQADKILLEDRRLKFSISTYEEVDAIMLYNAFYKICSTQYPTSSGELIIETVKIESTPPIKNDSITVKFYSPLVVRDHKKGKPDRYYVYSDKEFEETLNHIIEREFGKEEKFEIEAINAHKTVVRSFGTKIRCNIGTYKLTSKPYILDMLSKGGIGSRRSEGFGHFSVIKG